MNALEWESWDKHLGLEEKSVLLVDNEEALGRMVTHCVSIEGMEVTAAAEVPDNLLAFMNEREEGKEIEAAIVHPAWEREDLVDEIITARDAGKRMVVMSREPYLTEAEGGIYRRLEDAGVRCVAKGWHGDKDDYGYFKEALDELARQFAEE